MAWRLGQNVSETTALEECSQSALGFIKICPSNKQWCGKLQISKGAQADLCPPVKTLIIAT